MINYATIFLIAIALSMDAFSLSLAYGTLGLTKKEVNKLSVIVGIYHFFMPLIGLFFVILQILLTRKKTSDLWLYWK